MLDDQTPIDFKKLKVRIGDIRIDGVKATNEKYITNQFLDIFKANNFEDMLLETSELRKRLLQLGTFKDVDALVDVSKNKKPGNYDIVISVEEKSPIGGGIHTSVGNNDGSMNTKIFCPNLFGNGEQLGFEYAYGTNNHKDYRVNYSSPVNLNPINQFSATLFNSTNNFSWSKYSQNDTGIMFDYTAPFTWLINDKYEIKGAHSFTYEGTWRNLISSLDSTFDVREQSGHSLKSSVKYTCQVDKRDHPILPTSGGFVKKTVEIAGFGGDVRFFKTNCDYQLTKTLLKYFNVQLTVSNGFVLPLTKKSNVSITDKFFLGGPLTLRGFTNRGAGPQKEDCALGNTGYWLLGAHLYTPLPFLHKAKGLSSWLRTHSFVNMGNMVNLCEFKSLDKSCLEKIVQNTRLSVGSGVVIGFGNMARLELNYVYPLWKHQNDKSVNGLQFGIGIMFN